MGLNACAYSAGQNICFFQGHTEIPGWDQGQRLGARCNLSVDHVMASSAIPTIFPPVKINREYFGDGVTRQMAHLSPALHMGAKRILVIGVSANREHLAKRRRGMSWPGLAQVMEHVLNGLFLDTMEYDIDRLQMINQLVELFPRDKLNSAADLHLRPMELLEISPSEPINGIASRYLDGLPALLRRFLGKNLERGEGGASLASYLLFDPRFCKELIALGYQDAQAKSEELAAFLYAGRGGLRLIMALRWAASGGTAQALHGESADDQDQSRIGGGQDFLSHQHMNKHQ